MSEKPGTLRYGALNANGTTLEASQPVMTPGMMELADSMCPERRAKLMSDRRALLFEQEKDYAALMDQYVELQNAVGDLLRAQQSEKNAEEEHSRADKRRLTCRKNVQTARAKLGTLARKDMP